MLSKGQATKDEIVAGTGLSPTTTQNLLVSLVRAEQIVRVGIARYALPAEGLAGHVSTEAAIFDVLSAGLTSPAELRARTGKGAGEIAGGLHRLKKAGKIILTKRGMYSLYSLASTGARHVYAKEAIDDALRSGPKTVRELVRGGSGPS